MNQGDQSFTQLFVARSKNICNHVKLTVGVDPDDLEADGNRISFLTFSKLKDTCGDVFPLSKPKFKNRQLRINFSRFKREFTTLVSHSGLDALVVWTQIRSSIKGSVHAVRHRRALTLNEYLDHEIIGARRCRLTRDQRRAAYEAYQTYQKHLDESGLWDDSDHVVELLSLLNDNPVEGIRFSNIYVDEIQVSYAAIH